MYTTCSWNRVVSCEPTVAHPLHDRGNCSTVKVTTVPTVIRVLVGGIGVLQGQGVRRSSYQE